MDTPHGYDSLLHIKDQNTKEFKPFLLSGEAYTNAFIQPSRNIPPVFKTFSYYGITDAPTGTTVKTRELDVFGRTTVRIAIFSKTTTNCTGYVVVYGKGLSENVMPFYIIKADVADGYIQTEAGILLQTFALDISGCLQVFAEVHSTTGNISVVIGA